ncbi:ACHE [Symbiodinium natans]|uniref:ACHE protein n=1 Tax=Symbiodinium natans TaxID=878477 RepID=A0A812REE7_9DINO|nr:ACHE [Symbiodinium natans]
MASQGMVMKRRKNLINLGVVPAPLCRQKGDEDKAEPLCCQIRSKQKILGPFQMRRLLQSSGPHAGSDLGTYSTQLLCPAVTQEVCAAKPFSLYVQYDAGDSDAIVNVRHPDAQASEMRREDNEFEPFWLPDMRDVLGAFHFSELFFVMGNKDGPGGNLPFEGGALGFGLGWSKQDVKISANMSGSWGALVREEDVPSWPAWDTGEMLRFALNVPDNVDVVPVQSMLANHHCDFFDDLNVRLIKDVSN